MKEAEMGTTEVGTDEDRSIKSDQMRGTAGSCPVRDLKTASGGKICREELHKRHLIRGHKQLEADEKQMVC